MVKKECTLLGNHVITTDIRIIRFSGFKIDNTKIYINPIFIIKQFVINVSQLCQPSKYGHWTPFFFAGVVIKI